MLVWSTASGKRCDAETQATWKTTELTCASPTVKDNFLIDEAHVNNGYLFVYIYFLKTQIQPKVGS